jgi:hypothetical protein
MPFKHSGEGDIPEKIVLRMIPQNCTFMLQTASFEYQASKLTGALRRMVVTSVKKKKLTGKHKACNFAILDRGTP